jgi:hypothetical protein
VVDTRASAWQGVERQFGPDDSLASVGSFQSFHSVSTVYSRSELAFPSLHNALRRPHWLARTTFQMTRVSKRFGLRAVIQTLAVATDLTRRSSLGIFRCRVWSQAIDVWLEMEPADVIRKIDDLNKRITRSLHPGWWMLESLPLQRLLYYNSDRHAFR